MLYAKKTGISEKKIRRALLQQLQTNNSKFANRRDLLNAILDQPKDLTEETGKCVHCRREQRNALSMPCGHLLLCWACICDTDYCFHCKEREQKKSECTVVE